MRFQENFLKAFTTFIILLSSQNIFSQIIWQNILAEQRACQMLDSLTWFIVGDNGKILCTDDAGNKWRWLESGIRTNFSSVSFINNEKGIVVGDSGAVLSTNDGGSTWNVKYLDVPNLKKVILLDELISLTSGSYGNIYKTTDFGSNWQQIYSDSSTDILSLYFLNKDIGFAVGTNDLKIKTTDGGLSWKKMANINSDYDWYCIDFYNNSLGAISGKSETGGGILFLTTDSGTSWSDSIRSHGIMHSVKIINDKSLISLDDDGVLSRTDDLCKTWKFDTLKSASMSNIGLMISNIFPRSMASYNNEYFISVGYPLSIAVSNDSGKSFKLTNLCPILTKLTLSYLCYSNIHSFNKNEAVAYGQNLVTRTQDCGVMWNLVFPKDTAYNKDKNQFWSPYIEGNTFFYDDYFINENTGFLAGVLDMPSRNDSLTIESIDGGQTWSITNKIPAVSFSFSTNKKGVAVKDSFLFKTNDGGNLWERYQFVDNHSYLYQIKFLSESIGYILSQQLRVPTQDTINYPYGIKTVVKLYKTSDGGATFDSIYGEGNSERMFNRFMFLSRDTGYLIGYGEYMLKTTNGGMSWEEIKLPCKQRLNDLMFLNKDYAIACGSNDTILVSKDGDKTWIVEKLNIKMFDGEIKPNFNKIIRMKDQNIFFVGKGRLIRGVITDSSLMNIEEPLVERFNPYFYITTNPNPVTNHIKIKMYGLYSVKGKHLSLKVLDIYGNDVYDLSSYANENNDGIISEFETDISSLSTGVYFLRLLSDGYIKVEKFIVVK